MIMVTLLKFRGKSDLIITLPYSKDAVHLIPKETFLQSLKIPLKPLFAEMKWRDVVIAIS